MVEVPTITAEIEDVSVPDVVVLKFADSKIPVFKEARNKDYIKYGEDNLYPEYLTYLYNKSGKHGAIINGKANYIFGEGFQNGDFKINRNGESLNDVTKKGNKDVEMYGGFYFEVMWSRAGKVCEVYHVDFTTLRKSKCGTGYWWKETWDPANRDEPEFIPSFDPAKPFGSQIYAYTEYRPKLRYYPLPSYIASNNYIETDIEISKFYLSAIRNGMMPSKMLQFYMGDPGEEKKKQIERGFQKKFAGSENAGKFILVFNAGGKDKTIDVQDLSGTDLDKMFIELNKTVQQEIFSGHQVVSPMLFGIKTEGQLGGNTELQTAYELFVNTYAKPKANAIDQEVEFLLSYSLWPGEYELTQTEPVGWSIPDDLLKQAITPDEVREKLGLPVLEKPVDTPATKTLNALSGMSPLLATKVLENLTRDEVRALAFLPPVPGGTVIPNADGSTPQEPQGVAGLGEASAAPVNENLKNLTAKQYQQLMRVIREYSKARLTREAASHLLKTSLGLSDDEVSIYLGPIPAPVTPAPVQQMSAQEEEDAAAVFDQYGDAKDDFEILKSKKVCFSHDLLAEQDEEVFIQEAFKKFDVTATENRILELIKKDSRITPDVIATTIGQSKSFVESKIDSLVKRGYLETSSSMDGADEIIERSVPQELDITAPPPTSDVPPTQIFIKYSYEVKPGIGPAIIKTTRPFCKKMIELNRLYSRADIEKISLRLGYSVFDRKGGWWGKKPECRHRWVSHIVVKKGGSK